MRWFDGLKNEFTQLGMKQKLEVLFLMHNISSPNTLTEVSNHLTALISKDFVSLLPPKIINKILCNLDGKSLVSCAGVSHNWRSVVTNNTELWTRLVKQLLCSRGDLALNALMLYQLYMRVRRRVSAIKSMHARLEFPSIAEFSQNPELSSVKNIQSTPSGKLVLSYSVKQPQDFFQKCDVLSGCTSMILASLNTNYVVDFITTDLFLYSCSISGDWHCSVWESGEEVFKINTKHYGVTRRWFSSFATPCNRCPLLTIFDTNRISVQNDHESFCPIKMITSVGHEERGVQFGVKLGKLACSASPKQDVLVGNAVISCNDVTTSSRHTVCEHHKVILQQQDLQIFIYKVNTQPAHDLEPELLFHLKPPACPDVSQYIFDCYKFCLSSDQKLIGFTCGPELMYWNLDTKVFGHVTISGGYNNLMLVAIGDIFSLVAEVKTLISVQPLLILTGTGELVKVFPTLEPSNAFTNGQSKFHSFLTASVQVSWLSSSAASLNDDVMPSVDVGTVFAAVYNGGKTLSTWSLVSN